MEPSPVSNIPSNQRLLEDEKDKDIRADRMLTGMSEEIDRVVAKLKKLVADINKLDFDQLELTYAEEKLYWKRRSTKAKILNLIRRYAIMLTLETGRQGEDISDFDKVTRKFYKESLDRWKIREFDTYEVDGNDNRAHHGVYGRKAFKN